jgi:hypothetical protein
MRILVVLGALAALAPHAHADSVTATAPAPADSTYLQVGTLLGGDGEVGLAGLTVEGGHRMSNRLWLHGEIDGGGTFVVLDSGHGTFAQLRVGPETRGCTSRRFCVIGGIDAAVRYTDFHGESVFGDRMEVNSAAVAAIPRIQLDIGGAIRVRPGVELSVDSNGHAGGAATFGLAYTW